MTLMASGPRAHGLRQIVRELPVPEGIRVEIIGGQIVMSSTPSGGHALIVDALYRMLLGQIPDDYVCPTYLGVNKTSDSEDYSIPDLFVLPRSAVPISGSEVDPDEVILVVEVVSKSTADTDRVQKVEQYAAGYIPLYLLIDTRRREIVLYERPEDGDYQSRSRYAWGTKFELPEPLPATIDGARFPDLED